MPHTGVEVPQAFVADVGNAVAAGDRGDNAQGTVTSRGGSVLGQEAAIG